VVSTDIAIRDLAVIGDQRAAVVVGCDGTILWYCPGRFDHPTLLAGLLDPNGGAWRLDLPGAIPARRCCVEQSGVLETWLRAGDDEWSVTDWMLMGDEAPKGLVCRRSVTIRPAIDEQCRLTMKRSSSKELYSNINNI
jgi:hypothetical protein